MKGYIGVIRKGRAGGGSGIIRRWTPDDVGMTNTGEAEFEVLKLTREVFGDAAFNLRTLLADLEFNVKKVNYNNCLRAHNSAGKVIEPVLVAEMEFA